MGSPVPMVDDGVRRRLTVRFGDAVEPWFDELPGVLNTLAERWGVEFGSTIPRGSVSVVIRCRTSAGDAAVLKVSPDRTRLDHEAAALRRWTTVHTPAVLALDKQLGALLIEAIEPGIPLDSSSVYPSLESLVDLLTSLHADGIADPSYPTVAERVAYLFDSGAKPYKLRPELADVIPPELYQRGHRLATRLAQNRFPRVLLHGDLTPSNILDGGDARGLVAIDPAPCLGEAVFDAIDLVLWQADDVRTIEARVEMVASALDGDAERLLDWCRAFAGMTALELAGSPLPSPKRIRAAAALAVQAPTA